MRGYIKYPSDFISEEVEKLVKRSEVEFAIYLVSNGITYKTAKYYTYGFTPYQKMPSPPRSHRLLPLLERVRLFFDRKLTSQWKVMIG